MEETTVKKHSILNRSARFGWNMLVIAELLDYVAPLLEKRYENECEEATGLIRIFQHMILLSKELSDGSLT